MDNLIVNNYLSIIDRLDLESKLALLSALTENIKSSINKTKPNSNPDKLELLYSLYGAWSDVDESIIDDIYSHRTLSDREITFD